MRREQSNQLRFILEELLPPIVRDTALFKFAASLTWGKRVGRPKDFIRIAQFIESNAVDLGLLRSVLQRHKLTEAWRSFCRRTGMTDPLSTQP